MFNSIIGYKSVTYETEIHSLELKPSAVKAITPLRPSFYDSEPIILKCDLFGFDRVALEHNVSPNLEKSGNVDINTKLNGKQACQACNCLLFFEDREEPKPYKIIIIQIIARC